MKVSFLPLALSTSVVLVCLSPYAFHRAIAQIPNSTDAQARQFERKAEIKTLPSKSKRWALVIGVDDYVESQISKLAGAANDARTLAGALTKYAGFPEDQVTLLASDQPSGLQPRRSTVLRYLSNLRGTVPKDGLLLVAFAGHGIERSGRAFLLPSDALGVNDMTLLEDTAVSVDRVKESIRATGVSQVVLILDACRSDPSPGRSGGDNLMTTDFRNSFNFDRRNEDIRAFATLYATDVGERAYEYDVKKQGYFTWTLIEGLRGAAANDRGEVTLQRLVEYLQINVPKLVQRDLGSDKRQQPFAIIEGYLAADLVISVVNPALASSSTPDSASFERTFWESIKNSTDSKDFEAYLQKYPDGQFVQLAKNNLNRLKGLSNSGSRRPRETASRKSGATKILLNVTLKHESDFESYDQELTTAFLEALGEFNLDISDISSMDTRTRTRLQRTLEGLKAGYAMFTPFEIVIDADLALNRNVPSGSNGMFIASITGVLRVFDSSLGRAVITKSLSFRGFGLDQAQAVTNAKRNVREGLTEEILAKIADYAK